MTDIYTHESTSHTEGEDSVAPGKREWFIQIAGIIGGLVLAALVYFLFPSNAAETVLQSSGAEEGAEYSQQALRATAAITILMGAWWMTEALPLAANALLPLIVFPVLGVSGIKDVASPYASTTIFLFMGGFLIALGLQRWNVHRRLALMVVAAVGTSPKRLILGFMIATGFLSMWVSNTATAVVMLPIGMSVLQPVSYTHL